MPDSKKLDSLARYFLWSGMQAKICQRCVERDAANPDIYTFGAMSYWFSSLYVVIEGWRDLKLVDPEIDVLLADKKKVDELRLYRNATFHYRPKLLDKKFMGLMSGDAQETTDWLTKLHVAFERFFDEHRGEHTIPNDARREYDEWIKRGPSF